MGATKESLFQLSKTVSRIDWNRVRQMVEAGKTDTEIAAVYKIGKRSMCHWRQKMGIPSARAIRLAKNGGTLKDQHPPQHNQRLYRPGVLESANRAFERAMSGRGYPSFNVSADPGRVARPENPIGYGDSPLA